MILYNHWSRPGKGQYILVKFINYHTNSHFIALSCSFMFFRLTLYQALYLGTSCIHWYLIVKCVILVHLIYRLENEKWFHAAGIHLYWKYTHFTKNMISQFLVMWQFSGKRVKNTCIYIINGYVDFSYQLWSRGRLRPSRMSGIGWRQTVSDTPVTGSCRRATPSVSWPRGRPPSHSDWGEYFGIAVSGNICLAAMILGIGYLLLKINHHMTEIILNKIKSAFSQTQPLPGIPLKCREDKEMLQWLYVQLSVWPWEEIMECTSQLS